MKNETKTTIEKQLLEIFFKMDRNEADRHTIDSIASIYCQSNIVTPETKSKVSKALLSMYQEGLLVTVPIKGSKPISMNFTLRLNDELRKKLIREKYDNDVSFIQGSRRITTEYPFAQNLQYLCDMEDNLFRFC